MSAYHLHAEMPTEPSAKGQTARQIGLGDMKRLKSDSTPTEQPMLPDILVAYALLFALACVVFYAFATAGAAAYVDAIEAEMAR